MKKALFGPALAVSMGLMGCDETPPSTASEDSSTKIAEHTESTREMFRESNLPIFAQIDECVVQGQQSFACAMQSSSSKKRPPQEQDKRPKKYIQCGNRNIQVAAALTTTETGCRKDSYTVDSPIKKMPTNLVTSVTCQEASCWPSPEPATIRSPWFQCVSWKNDPSVSYKKEPIPSWITKKAQASYSEGIVPFEYITEYSSEWIRNCWKDTPLPDLTAIKRTHSYDMNVSHKSPSHCSSWKKTDNTSDLLGEGCREYLHYSQ